MRYQITTGFPIGDWFIESGTIVDASTPPELRSREETWALGHGPPKDSVALDQEAFDVMTKAYGGHGKWQPHRREE